MFKLLNRVVIILLLCLGFIVFISCAAHQNKYRRFLIVQTIPWITKSGELKLETLHDSVFVFDEKKVNGLRIVQLQKEHNQIMDTGVIHLPTVLDYFIYKPQARTGLFFEALKNFEYKKLSADSLMQYKVDKYASVDTISCLNGVPVKYSDTNGDVIYSYAHPVKSNENYDYDSLKFVYTTDQSLQNEYLSKLMKVKDGKFLYKIIFYNKQTFDKSINETLPAREIEIKVVEDNNFNENELERMIQEYKKVYEPKAP